MIVLAIDTSGSGCFAAVYDSERDAVLGEAGAEIGRGHAEQLMGFIDRALDAAGTDLASIGRIAVTIGPGSFTGIRVGVAAARGFSLALGVPSVGVTTLSALAVGHLRGNSGHPVLVAIDARRDEVYCQMFAADGTALTEPALLSVDAAARMAASHGGDVIGSATALLGREGEGAPAAVEIATVARLGARLDPHSNRPSPLYLRGPDAKPQLGFAIQRA